MEFEVMVIKEPEFYILRIHNTHNSDQTVVHGRKSVSTAVAEG